MFFIDSGKRLATGEHDQRGFQLVELGPIGRMFRFLESTASRQQPGQPFFQSQPQCRPSLFFFDKVQFFVRDDEPRKIPTRGDRVVYAVIFRRWCFEQIVTARRKLPAAITRLQSS